MLLHLMLNFFYNSVEFESKASVNEVISTLKFNLKPPDSQTLNSEGNEFTGRIKDHEFTVNRRRTLGRNSFLAIGYGEISPTENGTNVKMYFALKPMVRYVLVFLMIINLLLFFFVFFYSSSTSTSAINAETLEQIRSTLDSETYQKLIQNNPPKSGKSSVLSLLILPFFFMLLGNWLFQKDAKFIKEMIKGLLT